MDGHLKSTAMLERLDEEIRRRTRVVGVPNTESCLRLIGALYVETHEASFEDNRYLKVSPLTKHKNVLKTAA